MADEKQLTVAQPGKRVYTRTITTTPITFECEECHQVVTVEQFPGGAPHYCFDCVGTVTRRRNAERVRRHRERQREQR
jgi:hypothetical protein